MGEFSSVGGGEGSKFLRGNFTPWEKKKKKTVVMFERVLASKLIVEKNYTWPLRIIESALDIFEICSSCP